MHIYCSNVYQVLSFFWGISDEDNHIIMMLVLAKQAGGLKLGLYRQ